MPFISISHLGKYGTCCPGLGAIQSCCLFFRAGALWALQKCMLHCSAVARYPDWFTWASPIQTYFSLPPSGEIMPLSLNLLCIAEGLLTPTWSSHICFCPCMGRTEEGGSGLLAEGNEVIVRDWRQQEASLRQHWRQKDGTVFGVEHKKWVLGKRGARSSTNVLLSV